MKLKDWRLKVAKEALELYVTAEGGGDRKICEEDLTDLIADICHFGTSQGHDMEDLVERALDHWRTELVDEDALFEGEQEVIT